VTWAHGYVVPADAWSAWEFQPLVAAAALAVVVLYHRGHPRTTAARRRAAAFYVGVALGVLATMSPLHALGQTLFAGHMIQHLILLVAAAPLLAFGRPVAILAGLPRWPRRRLGRIANAFRPLRGLPGNPVVVWCSGTVALWAWHLPKLYEWALRTEVLHGLEHASFLAAGFLMWRLVPGIADHRLSHAAAVGLIFATALQSAALGAILAFASRPLYSVHTAGASAWGLTPIADQQLAGAVMWIPPGVIYLATMAVLLHRWFARMDALYSPTEGPG
jgi:putative membrane protein